MTKKTIRTIEDLQKIYAENRKNFPKEREKQKARDRLTYKKAHEHVFG